MIYLTLATFIIYYLYMFKSWFSLTQRNVPYLYLYLYFNSIDPYWLPKPSDIEHVTYAYISSKHNTLNLQLHS
jgi:hypothetical protein